MIFSPQRHTALAIACLCFLALGCTRPGPNVVKTKSLALNPKEYLGAKVFIRGTIERVFPAGVAFILADDSGKILVSTEDISTRFICPKGATVEIDGRLKQTPDSRHVYFSLNTLHDCNTMDSKKRKP